MQLHDEVGANICSEYYLIAIWFKNTKKFFSYKLAGLLWTEPMVKWSKTHLMKLKQINKIICDRRKVRVLCRFWFSAFDFGSSCNHDYKYFFTGFSNDTICYFCFVQQQLKSRSIVLLQHFHNEVPSIKKRTHSRYDVTVWHLYENQKTLATLSFKLSFLCSSLTCLFPILKQMSCRKLGKQLRKLAKTHFSVLQKDM